MAGRVTVRCPHETAIGIYLLGSLDPADRAEMQTHLAGCWVCRGTLAELEWLPGLLSQLTQQAVIGAPDSPAEPPSPTSAAARRGVTRSVAVDSHTSVQASVTVTPVATGSHLLLTLSGADPRQRCQLIAIGKDGRQEVTASWMTTDGGQARVAGSTSLASGQIQRLLVTALKGKALVSLPTPCDPTAARLRTAIRSGG